jgi:signal transduction histidine kinase
LHRITDRNLQATLARALPCPPESIQPTLIDLNPDAATAKSSQTPEDSHLLEQRLQRMAINTAYLIGDEFFARLCEELAEILDVSTVYIGQYIDSSRLRTNAFYHLGTLQENFEYDLTNTPCLRVSQAGQNVVPFAVQARYPLDDDLVKLGVEAYAGLSLQAANGNYIGQLCLLHQKPMDDNILQTEAIRRVRARCSAELERLLGQGRHRADKLKYENILNASIDAVYLRARNGIIQFSNQTAQHLFNESGTALTCRMEPGSTEIVEQQEHSRGKLMEILEQADQDLLDSGCVQRTELQLPNNEIFHSTHTPFYSTEGTLIGAVGSLRNVTQLVTTRKMLADAQNLASLGTIAAGIAHEINNPLTAIQLNAELARRQDGLTPETDDYLSSILDAGQTATEIVRAALQSARRSGIELAVCNLANVLFKAIDQMRCQARQMNLDIEVIERCDCEVKGNALELQRVFVNLLDNAITATHKQGKRIQIFVGPVEGRAVAWIRDYGCGIAEKDLPHIFEPFYTTKRTGGGTGLGLGITRGIIAAHGGCIDVESFNDGARFTVRMPLASDDVAKN